MLPYKSNQRRVQAGAVKVGGKKGGRVCRKITRAAATGQPVSGSRQTTDSTHHHVLLEHNLANQVVFIFTVSYKITCFIKSICIKIIGA